LYVAGPSFATLLARSQSSLHLDKSGNARL
jgi:hypothetical protein